jgi:hypothetical protein
VADAPWDGKAGPWLVRNWWAAKDTLWNGIEDLLTGASMGFDILGFGAGGIGLICG